MVVGLRQSGKVGLHLLRHDGREAAYILIVPGGGAGGAVRWCTVGFHGDSYKGVCVCVCVCVLCVCLCAPTYLLIVCL